MPTMNEAWMDALIRHQVGLMRMAPAINAQVSGLLNATEKDIKAQILARAEKGMSTARLDNLLKTIKATRSKAWKEVRKEWAAKMQELAQAEPEFLDRTLSTLSPATLDITLPSAAALGSIAKNTPFEGDTMAGWAQRVEASDLQRIEQSIKIGLAQGQSSQDIARRIVGSVQMKGTDGVTQITRNNANAITRTAVNSIANASRQEFYKENAELFSGEVFLATLDARTTLICASNDNKQFKVGEGPVPPLHWNCRSLRLAIVNGEVIGERPMKNYTEKQLLREYSEANGFKAPAKRDSLPQGHKGKFDTFAKKRMREMTGTVPAKLSYQEWLKGQSASFQDDVLGKARGKLFREGGVTLDKFVNKNGDKISLAKLKQLDEQGLLDKGHVPMSSASSTGAVVDMATPPAPSLPIPKPDLQKMQQAATAAQEAVAAEKLAAQAKLQQDLIDQQVEIEAEFEKRLAEMKAAEKAAHQAELKAQKLLAQQEAKAAADKAKAEAAAAKAKHEAELAAAKAEAEAKAKLAQAEPAQASKAEFDQYMFQQQKLVESGLEELEKQKAITAEHQYWYKQAKTPYAKANYKKLIEQSKYLEDVAKTKVSVADSKLKSPPPQFKQQAAIKAATKPAATPPKAAEVQAPASTALEKHLHTNKQLVSKLEADIADKQKLDYEYKKLYHATNTTPSEKSILEAKIYKNQLGLQADVAKKASAEMAIQYPPVSLTTTVKKPAEVLQKNLTVGSDTIQQLKAKHVGQWEDHGHNTRYSDAAMDHFSRVEPDITGAQRTAIKAYGGSSYGEIRYAQAIKAGISPSALPKAPAPARLKWANEQIEPLAKGQAKLAVKNPGRLYRGMDVADETLEQWIKSGVIDQTNEPTLSTSISQKVAHNYSSRGGRGRQKVVLQYDKPKEASPLLSPLASYSHELEMLLKGSKQRIKSVVYSADIDKWTIRLEDF